MSKPPNVMVRQFAALNDGVLLEHQAFVQRHGPRAWGALHCLTQEQQAAAVEELLWLRMQRDNDHLTKRALENEVEALKRIAGDRLATMVSMGASDGACAEPDATGEPEGAEPPRPQETEHVMTRAYKKPLAVGDAEMTEFFKPSEGGPEPEMPNWPHFCVPTDDPE